MAEREWKPGDVAIVTTECCGAGVAVMDRDGEWTGEAGSHNSDGSGVTARPLVVIDPVAITGPDETGEDGDPLAEIANCLRRLAEGDHESSYRRRVAERLAKLFDPKPAEPTRLGAVVVDRDGSTLVRVDNGTHPWRASGGGRFGWIDVDHLTTLSEGAEPMADWEIDLLRGAR